MSVLDVENRRAIVDRRKVAERLSSLKPGRKLTGDASALLREVLAAGRAEIARRLRAQPGHGRAAAQAHAFLHDQIVRLAHDFVCDRIVSESLGDGL
ncbi:MAG TPA: hypothetical protein VJ597_04520, partial [Sphingomicrobium sp.]|nr:hypothetical protein [Sphingomicrobium sp.]